MKKTFSALTIVTALSLAACGGATDEQKNMSEEEKRLTEEREKAKMDSIFNAATKNMDAASDSGATSNDSVPK